MVVVINIYVLVTTMAAAVRVAICCSSSSRMYMFAPPVAILAQAGRRSKATIFFSPPTLTCLEGSRRVTPFNNPVLETAFPVV